VSEKLVVDPRFCGPPGIANGGVLAGLFARGLAGAVEVKLRAPSPLGTPLEVETRPDGSLRLSLAGAELATASSAPLELEVPAPPSPEAIAAREGNCRALRTHPFPRCFVCGPERPAGDGLRIFPGVIPGTELVAALWRPERALCDAAGRVRPEHLWAALDCPSAFPLLESEAARALEPMVLAKLHVALDGELCAGECARVLAWPLALEGKRGLAGAALVTESGRVIGRARATWVSLAGRS
jgi:hypothetical protein